MIDKDKYEGLIDAEGYIDYDGLDHLLAEVEQLREQNEFLREEVKKDDAGVKAVDALLGGIKNRNEEVKRLREENDELHAQRVQISWIQEARGGQSNAFELLAEVKRLRGLLDEIDDVVYYNDKKAGLVLPVEKPNLELLRDIMMSYTDEAYQIRGDEGEVIE